MMYLLVRRGRIIKQLHAIDGRTATQAAQEEGGIAVLVVGKQGIGAEIDHILGPLREVKAPTQEEAEEFISQADIERIMANDGVEVTSEKTDDQDD